MSVKFSLIVCNYNNGHFFKRCLPSIVNQTYKNFEVIVIDDCSTDDSVKVIKEQIKDYPNFKFHQNEKNLGYSGSLHRGIQLASGEFVARIDPDDALYENAIEISLKKFEEHPDIIATYSQIMLCDDDLNPQSLYPRTKKIKNGQRLFFNINNEVSHFFTFKKAAYENTPGINTKLRSSVDFDLYLKLYEVGNFEMIEEPLYFYRQHQGGVSQNKKKKKSIKKNWNQVLYDTCERRGILKIGKHNINKDADLAKIIFEAENNIASKIKRFLRKI